MTPPSIEKEALPPISSGVSVLLFSSYYAGRMSQILASERVACRILQHDSFVLVIGQRVLGDAARTRGVAHGTALPFLLGVRAQHFAHGIHDGFLREGRKIGSMYLLVVVSRCLSPYSSQQLIICVCRTSCILPA